VYLTATKTGQRPSALLAVRDEWAAFQLDSAVVTFGQIIESLLNETDEIDMGDTKRIVSRYKLSELLDPKFYVNAPRHGPVTAGVGELKSIQGVIFDEVG
jgi:hypothetical protein